MGFVLRRGTPSLVGCSERFLSLRWRSLAVAAFPPPYPPPPPAFSPPSLPLRAAQPAQSRRCETARGHLRGEARRLAVCSKRLLPLQPVALTGGAGSRVLHLSADVPGLTLLYSAASLCNVTV